MKALFLLVDGIADLGIQEYENQTPLQKLNLEYFDLLSKSGLNGIIDPVDIGLACGSDTAHLSIFGYNSFKEYKGRGSFETMGSGLDMVKGEIGFKCNFAYMNDEKVVEKRRVDREFPKWGLPLIEEVNKIELKGKFQGIKISAQHATEHRIGLKLTGDKLSFQISNTDPLKDNLQLKQCLPLNKTCPNSIFTAELINHVSEQITITLENHIINKERKEKSLPQANVILLRGVGEKLDVQTFEERWGIKGFMIAPTAIINGLGQTIGLDIITAPNATGDYHSDYISKIKTALEHIHTDKYNFGFIHIKAVDEAGHDKSLSKKELYIQKSDELVKYFYENCKKECVFVLTGDHSTPVQFGDHSYEPVPFVISSLNQMKNQNNKDIIDDVQNYDEISCAQGKLGRFKGIDIIKVIKNYAKKINFD